MAVVAYPRYPEQLTIEQENPADEQEWVVQGTESTPIAYATLVAAVAALYPAPAPGYPSNYLGFWLQRISLTYKGSGFWDATLHYGKQLPLLPGLTTFQARTSGKTIHREQSLATVHWYDALGEDLNTTPDFQQLIGVDLQNQSVAGVDVTAPSFDFTVNRKFLATELPNNYLTMLKSATGTVNVSPVNFLWKGQVLYFDIGELLFQGANITDAGQQPQTGIEMIEVNAEFSGSDTDTNLTVANITGIQKVGWEYLWVLRQTQVDAAANSLVLVPRAVYIEQVYEYSDFAAFLLF